MITEQYLTDIADGIREVNGTENEYTPAQMKAAIVATKKVLTTKSIAANGTYNASSDNADGYSSVTVDVPSSTLITKSITENGTYNAASDSADGYSSVTVAVPNSYAAGDEGKVVSNGALVAQTARASEITDNGTYDTTENNSVTVNVSGGGSGHEADPPSYDISATYQEVEYIICQGTQWVQTPQYAYPIMIQTEYKFTGTDSNRCVIGYRASTTNSLDWNVKNGNAFWSRGGNSYAQVGNFSDKGDGWWELYCAIYHSSSTRYVYIGNYYSSYSASAGLPWIGYIKKVTIRAVNGYTNPVVGYFIPCYRKSDGVVGMYNVSDSTFYTPSGTGSFDKGPDVA